MTDYLIKMVNNHIIINNEQKLVFDTGSPLSFHSLGHIFIGDETITVPTSLPEVLAEYLSQNIGCDVQGLIAMDIINNHSTTISLKDGFLLMNDDAPFGTEFCNLNMSRSLGGLLCIKVKVNKRTAKMIVDSGAKISYISPNFVNGMKEENNVEDFSPYIGNFLTPLFTCDVDLLVGGISYSQQFGILPAIISTMLFLYGADGLFGVELFKRYRLQIMNGRLFFPPQGI
ncbi:hypothetical protein [Xylanibacter brevis]|uniref:hypothetical protein n=1 Tax=Xylanibacter brevis TaxID=83231 RepID=UPI000488FF90|nr:hypothetical protein [Xylanibacter brevis]